jgi:nucleotide-binding universal stress UspA family protein
MSTSTTKPRIVVGVDGSDPSKTALRWARFMAETLGGEVQAVAAWRGLAGWSGMGMGYSVPPADWNPEKSTVQMLDASIDEVFPGDRPANLTSVVREGGAAEVLIDAGQGAQMLVVGSRGHGGFAGLVLGAVSTACAEHATCSVVVVRGATPDRL